MCIYIFIYPYVTSTLFMIRRPARDRENRNISGRRGSYGPIDERNSKALRNTRSSLCDKNHTLGGNPAPHSPKECDPAANRRGAAVFAQNPTRRRQCRRPGNKPRGRTVDNAKGEQRRKTPPKPNRCKLEPVIAGGRRFEQTQFFASTRSRFQQVF